MKINVIFFSRSLQSLDFAKKKADIFKKVVTDTCKKYAFSELMKEKEKRTKGENLIYKNLDIQTYLVSDKINSRDAIFLFKVRTQMLDVRKNYRIIGHVSYVFPIHTLNTDSKNTVKY